MLLELGALSTWCLMVHVPCNQKILVFEHFFNVFCDPTYIKAGNASGSWCFLALVLYDLCPW